MVTAVEKVTNTNISLLDPIVIKLKVVVKLLKGTVMIDSTTREDPRGWLHLTSMLSW